MSGRGFRRVLRAAAACALAGAALAGADGAAAAVDGPRYWREAAEPTYLVARPKAPDGGLALRASPGGKVLARLPARNVFGERPTLSVVVRQGAWIGVVATELENGRLGWVRRRDVDLSVTSVSIVVDVSERRLTLRVGARPVRSVTVAVGTARTPTPGGRFTVIAKVPGERYGPWYGCCALGLSGHQTRLPPGWAGGDLIGIHGTNAPESIGLAVSAGCLRAPEADLRVLMRVVPLGAPVFIHA